MKGSVHSGCRMEPACRQAPSHPHLVQGAELQGLEGNIPSEDVAHVAPSLVQSAQLILLRCAQLAAGHLEDVRRGDGHAVARRRIREVDLREQRRVGPPRGEEQPAADAARAARVLSAAAR